LTATFNLDMQDSCLTLKPVKRLGKPKTATGPARRGLAGAKGSTATAIGYRNQGALDDC